MDVRLWRQLVSSPSDLYYPNLPQRRKIYEMDNFPSSPPFRRGGSNRLPASQNVMAPSSPFRMSPFAIRTADASFESDGSSFFRGQSQTGSTSLAAAYKRIAEAEDDEMVSDGSDHEAPPYRSNIFSSPLFPSPMHALLEDFFFHTPDDIIKRWSKVRSAIDPNLGPSDVKLQVPDVSELDPQEASLDTEAALEAARQAFKGARATKDQIQLDLEAELQNAVNAMFAFSKAEKAYIQLDQTLVKVQAAIGYWRMVLSNEDPAFAELLCTNR